MPVYPKKKLAQLLLQFCVEHQIENVIISPGSRNAPLTIGFVNHPEINALSVVDERSAGFFALGMAQQTERPVVLLCTSGSALLNYYPAIAEAYYSRVPLIVLSADRPPHLIDIGDGQTIRQEKVFESHILYEATLKEALKDEKPEEVLRFNAECIQRSFQAARQLKGPVHLNVPFDEPLYEKTEELHDFSGLVTGYVKKKAAGSLLEEQPVPLKELEKYAGIWNRSKKKIVLIGAQYPDDLIRVQVRHLVKDPSVLVLTETTSNVHDERCINNIDQLIFMLEEQEQKDFSPEVLVTFGGMVVSKRIKQLLRKHPPRHHWHIDPFQAPDTYHCLDRHFAVSPQLFFSQFFFLSKPLESDYQDQWIAVMEYRKTKHHEFLKTIPFSDMKVFEMVLGGLPEACQLQLANSSVVRYSQLFDLDPSLRVFCNRGTSGIDGSTSTAIGAAHAFDGQTVFITGDLSFFYDSNALWNKYLPETFRIILVNNGGGGIFRILPGPKRSGALEYFETPHNLHAGPLCEMHGLEYRRANNEVELNQALEGFYEASELPILLEIFTPYEMNDEVLMGYFRSIS